MDDLETPKTDALVEELLHADGIPRCKEWDRLLDHAKEMERMAHVYRAVAAAENRTTK